MIFCINGVPVAMTFIMSIITEPKEASFDIWWDIREKGANVLGNMGKAGSTFEAKFRGPISWYSNFWCVIVAVKMVTPISQVR